MASFVLSFFPLDVLDEIWDLIESVSEGFLTYSFTHILTRPKFISSLVFRSKERVSFDPGKVWRIFSLKRLLN